MQAAYSAIKRMESPPKFARRTAAVGIGQHAKPFELSTRLNRVFPGFTSAFWIAPRVVPRLFPACSPFASGPTWPQADTEERLSVVLTYENRPCAESYGIKIGARGGV